MGNNPGLCNSTEELDAQCPVEAHVNKDALLGLRKIKRESDHTTRRDSDCAQQFCLRAQRDSIDCGANSNQITHSITIEKRNSIKKTILLPDMLIPAEKLKVFELKLRKTCKSHHSQSPLDQEIKELSDNSIPSQGCHISIGVSPSTAVRIMQYLNSKKILATSSGTTYLGESKSNMPEGLGAELLCNDSLYIGQFSSGFKTGYGTLFTAEGQGYSGYFLKGEIHGFGTYDWGNGKRYVGQWKLGLMHGTGTLTYKTSDRFEGEFRNSLKQGTGKIVYKDGSVFYGQWLDDQIQGECRLEQFDGNIFSLVYEKGERVQKEL